MAQKLEEILANLCVPDNETIQQANEQLKGVFKDPAVIPALCQVLGSSQQAQVRQYAAVLLRKRLKSKKYWEDLNPTISTEIRRNILRVLLNEPEKSIQKAICHFIVTIGKHDMPANRWPELFAFIQQYTQSDNVTQREIGMFVLHTLASTAGEQLQPHFGSLLELCAFTLTDTASPLVPFYTLQTLTDIVPLLGTDELKPFQNAIPKMIEVIGNLIAVDEEQAVEAMDIFDELIGCEVAVIVPHLKQVLEFCMQIAANKNFGDALRIKAMSFIMHLVRLKRKAVLKMKLIKPLLDVLFPVMCTHSEDEDFDENETQAPSTVAAQVLDVMAMHLPPEKFIFPLNKMLEPLLASSNPNERAAVFMAMAVVSEGCADYIMGKLLKTWLHSVYKGLEDPSQHVRNVAMFAMGQFAEHLQPDIAKFSQELVPVLFQNLAKAQANIDKNSRGMTKPYYALEMFVENMEENDLLPHLPQMMEFLLTSISSSPSYRAKELAVSSIAAVANSAKKELIPYFQMIVEQFSPYLEPTEDENVLKVQIQALDTLGVLARTLEKHFMPLATQCMERGMALLQDASDPDLRRCIYGMFAALSTILKADMGPYLDRIVPNMLASVTSTEGITAHLEEDSELFSALEDDEEQTLEEENDDDEIAGYSVENAYMDEKEDACRSLGEIAVNSGLRFMKHIEVGYNAVKPLLEHPSPEIRKGAVVAASQFCIALSKAAEATKDVDAQTALFQLLHGTLPLFFTMVREDQDRQLVMTILDELKNMLDSIRGPMLQGQGQVDHFLSIVSLVIHRQTKCQDRDDEENTANGAGDEEDEEDEEAEFDSMLVESAGELLPSLASVLGGQAFAPFFTTVLPALVKKTKRNNSVPDRSFAIGTIAETVEAMGGAVTQFVPTLYALCTKMVGDADDEVRSNAIYALGVVASHGGQSIYQYYPNILKLYFDQLHVEKHPRAQDNIYAAVCRMIMANTPAVPLHQVLPPILRGLPLKEDLDEYKTVVACLTALYRQGHADVKANLGQMVRSLAEVVATDKLKAENKEAVAVLLMEISASNSADFQAAVASMPKELSQPLQTFLAGAQTQQHSV